jgi:hypothetical protein
MDISREDWVKIVEAEIQHNISPVIGWLRMDASKGKVDEDESRVKAFNERVTKAAEDIASIIERNMT